MLYLPNIMGCIRSEKILEFVKEVTRRAKIYASLKKIPIDIQNLSFGK